MFLPRTRPPRPSPWRGPPAKNQGDRGTALLALGVHTDSSRPLPGRRGRGPSETRERQTQTLLSARCSRTSLGSTRPLHLGRGRRGSPGPRLPQSLQLGRRRRSEPPALPVPAWLWRWRRRGLPLAAPPFNQGHYQTGLAGWRRPSFTPLAQGGVGAGSPDRSRSRPPAVSRRNVGPEAGAPESSVFRLTLVRILFLSSPSDVY